MPLYAYRCTQCGHKFEKIQNFSAEPEMVCPKCVRGVFGHHPPVPEIVEVTILKPPGMLGSMRDALRWDRNNAERWIEEGHAAAKNISILNCLER